MTRTTEIHEAGRKEERSDGSLHVGGIQRDLPAAGRALVARIGDTPLVPLPSPKPSVRLLGKAEWLNPGGSVKDRTAWGIVRGALERGDLVTGPSGEEDRDGRRLLDASSGNTAIAYAMLGAALGIDVTICLPANASRERRTTLAAYGAEVLLTDEMEGTDGASERARELAEARPDDFWYADQYSNPDNWRVHHATTAEEIWAETEGEVTHLVAGLGTTGTLVGTGRRLRELNPRLRVVAVQPATALHGLEGLKHLPTNRRPAIYDPTVADEHRPVRTEAAREAALELARRTGLFVGPSSGAALVAARDVASEIEEGTVATILPDGGARYLSEAWWSADERPVAAGPELVIPAAALASLRQHLEEAHPAEGCGVLVGEVEDRAEADPVAGDVRRVLRAVPAENLNPGRNDRYEIDPGLLRDLMESEDAGGPRVLGFYHSHPDVEPVPSSTDRERAWPWYVYLIVRVDGEGAREGRVWRFEPDGSPVEGTLRES